MKTVTKVLLTAAAALGLSTAAHADLTLNGVSGMFLNPDARISSSLVPQVQANYNDLGDGAKSYGLYAAYGLGGKTEVGAGIGHLDTGGDSRSGFAVNLNNRSSACLVWERMLLMAWVMTIFTSAIFMGILRERRILDRS